MNGTSKKTGSSSGQGDDDKDKRLIEAILKTYINPDLVEQDNYPFSESGMSPPEKRKKSPLAVARRTTRRRSCRIWHHGPARRAWRGVTIKAIGSSAARSQATESSSKS